MKDHIYYVYILTNTHNTVLYTGVTSNLGKRCYEHKNKTHKGFTSKYNVHKLVYFETYSQIRDNIYREKRLKKYSIAKKMDIILKFNNELNDLFKDGMIIYPLK